MITEPDDPRPARYTGPTERLYGETAMIRPCPDDPAGAVLAQFDKHLYVGGVDLGVGWHEFARTSFTREL